MLSSFKRKVSVSSIKTVNNQLGNWLPGSTNPSYLEKITGSYGFDPLGLGSSANDLSRFQEAELIHCRWAMLGVAGALGVEAFGYGNWYDAPLSAEQTYFGTKIPLDLTTLVVIEFVVMAAVEARRSDESDISKKLYPGFDIAGLVKDPKSFESMKVKEIKNGRLAMMAFRFYSSTLCNR
jgi:hypothetical protein